MKDKTLEILGKFTKLFNLLIDFLMEKTIILMKKIISISNVVFCYLASLLICFIDKIEHSDSYKFFEKRVHNWENNIIKRIPNPILQTFIYILDSLMYFVKTLFLILLKLTKFILIDIYLFTRTLPKKQQRILYIGIILAIITFCVFNISSQSHLKSQDTAKIETLKTEEVTIEKESEILAPILKREEIVIKSGDTLVELLQVNSNIDYNEISSLLTSLKTCYDPRKLIPGKKINLLFQDDLFIGIEINISPEETCIVTKDKENNFIAKTVQKELFPEIISKEFNISNSIFVDGQKAKIPYNMLLELMKMYSWDVDFVRDIRKGDAVNIMYEELMDDDKNFVKYGNVVYANMNLSGANISIYRYKDDYYKENGANIKKALLRTPINGARISSPFGMRKHPILGYSKMHTGIDFAAPIGTPIYAAGDGKVVRRFWNGGYGNYIEIHHSSSLSSAYGHMSKFASNLHVGSRVKQGQVIGYVGSTGRSTGPHLHYEIIKDGKKVNPATVKLPNKKSLEGEELIAFKQEITKIKSQIGILILPEKKPTQI